MLDDPGASAEFDALAAAFARLRAHCRDRPFDREGHEELRAALSALRDRLHRYQQRRG